MEEIIEEFFDHSFEDVVNEDMFERDYNFPQSKVEDYIMSVVSTPYQQFIDYVCSHYNPKPIENSDIPQISNYEACTVGVCQVMKFRDNPGMDCVELGKALFTDDVERKEGAFFKFGENQVKGASFHGLTHCYYKKWFLTCLGFIYPELDNELQQYLAARTLLRNPFFYLIISEAKEKDVNIKKYMAGLSTSTQIRRSSSCMHFFDVILRQCQIENVSLHSIYFDKNEISPTLVNNESISDNYEDLADRQRNKSKNIYVILPNGNKIMRKNAIETFIATLQYIGLSRVATYKERLFSGYPLVGKIERGGAYKWQKEVDGWYVYTYISNDTKIQLLKDLSAIFNLNLKIAYEDFGDDKSKDDQIESAKPCIADLSINRLCSIFFDVSTTEKFFWFISILQICFKAKSNKVLIRQIVIRMIANAWYPIIRRNLSFGYSDPLSKLTKDLHYKLQIPLDLNVDEIVDLINKNITDPAVSNALWRLSRNTPSDFLRPWVEKDYICENKDESQNKTHVALYSIFDEYIEGSYIIIDKNWKAYLQNNYTSLLNFTYRQLAKFIKLRNKQIIDLVTLLKHNNDTIAISQTDEDTHCVDRCSFYVLNTNKAGYIFNSQYDEIYTSSGKIIEFNKRFYRVILSEDNFVVREIKIINNKQAVLSNSIINALFDTPLYTNFENKFDLDKIEDIRIKSSDGQHEIKVLGKWYNNKGKLIKNGNQQETVSTKTFADLSNSSNDVMNEDSSFIGKYIRLFPSHAVGKIINTKITPRGDKKIVIQTFDGEVKEIYNNPYLYEVISPSKVPNLIKD